MGVPRIYDKPVIEIPRIGRRSRAIEIPMPNFTPPQREFVFSTQRYLMFNGGVGAGKTFTNIWRALIFAFSMPGSTGLICAYTAPMINDSVLGRLLDIMKLFPKNLWDFKKGEKNLYLPDSMIRFRQLDSEETLRGPEYTYIGIEEMTVGISEMKFDQLGARLRECNKGYCSSSTNPGPKTSYLYKRFFEERHNFDNYSVITAPTDSNAKNLPKDYIADLMQRPEAWRKRFLMGEWGAMEGSVYQEFDRRLHIQHIEIKTGWEYYLLMDYGFKNPFACLVMAFDGVGTFYVLDEYYKRGEWIDFHIEYIENNFMDRQYEALIGDPAGSENLDKCRKKLKIRSIPARKDVKDGIEAVALRLVGKAGVPQLYIDPRCVNLIREFESYEWKKDIDGKASSEEPNKLNDHALDALRYGIYTLVKKYHL